MATPPKPDFGQYSDPLADPRKRPAEGASQVELETLRELRAIRAHNDREAKRKSFSVGRVILMLILIPIFIVLIVWFFQGLGDLTRRQ